MSNWGRAFETHSERHGGAYRQVARLACCKCGVTESINAAGSGGVLPDNVISKKFHQKGWETGSSRKHDLCSACVNRKKIKVVSMEPAVKAEVPREMSREDRRVIFEKLNETYVDEASGYAPGWSDNRVAIDLGVPRAWVAKVRDEMFGPIGTNPDMTAFLKEAEDLLADTKNVLAEARSLRDEAEGFIREMKTRMSGLGTFDDRLGKIERLASDIRKMAAL